MSMRKDVRGLHFGSRKIKVLAFELFLLNSKGEFGKQPAIEAAMMESSDAVEETVAETIVTDSFEKKGLVAKTEWSLEFCPKCNNLKCSPPYYQYI